MKDEFSRQIFETYSNIGFSQFCERAGKKVEGDVTQIE